ncbi:MAG: hydroxymethylpyrimidine/phosphomethylpyrimidine kinase [Gammaproteobacteria bacterium]|nr:MAG: hydroxymethylpyrimidine/phosphomethylpyrimidine kinase [Gammaproteobacteria bacterium]
MTNEHPPVVMSFAGTDPSGGAGIQAAIEAISSHGCHASTVVTCVTVQDTENVYGFAPLDPDVVIDQARAILEDMSVSAFHIGMIGNADTAEAINSILVDYPDIPVVLDPVLAAGGGTPLADGELIDAILNMLLPVTTVVTPNTKEAFTLSYGADTTDACAISLLESGCEAVLLTGTHDSTDKVTNSFYQAENPEVHRFDWDRLSHEYHGSGCTLAASIAAFMATGMEPLDAVIKAQEYTWFTLVNANRIGMGQLIPDRLFWARDFEE